MDIADQLQAAVREIERLKSENAELEATVLLLRNDVAVLGPENARLWNAYSAARAEIGRLNAKRSRGRPAKMASGGTFDEYLARETYTVITEWLQRGEKINERDASIIANARIRATAANLQESGMPGAFHGLATSYIPDDDSIYNAMRRGKRRLGLIRPRQTKK